VALNLAVSLLVINEVDMGERIDPMHHTPEWSGESDIEIQGDNEVRFQDDSDDD
jgi:hypothetical protein